MTSNIAIDAASQIGLFTVSSPSSSTFATPSIASVKDAPNEQLEYYIEPTSIYSQADNPTTRISASSLPHNEFLRAPKIDPRRHRLPREIDDLGPYAHLHISTLTIPNMPTGTRLQSIEFETPAPSTLPPSSKFPDTRAQHFEFSLPPPTMLGLFDLINTVSCNDIRNDPPVRANMMLLPSPESSPKQSPVVVASLPPHFTIN